MKIRIINIVDEMAGKPALYENADSTAQVNIDHGDTTYVIRNRGGVLEITCDRQLVTRPVAANVITIHSEQFR